MKNMEPTVTQWMETRPPANLTGFTLDNIGGHITCL